MRAIACIVGAAAATWAAGVAVAAGSFLPEVELAAAKRVEERFDFLEIRPLPVQD